MIESLLLEIEDTIKLYEKIANYPATRTRQMIERKGVIKALSDLVISGEIQKGFKLLAEKNKLDKSFESVILRYDTLFDPEIVNSAKWRLDNYDKLF